MQTLHPADRVIRPDQVEVSRELEAEIRGIEVGRPRGRGLWWAVAALVVAVLAVVLWPAATAAEVHDSWMNVPLGPAATAAEVHDSWMSESLGLTPIGFEIHDSWGNVPVGLIPIGFEIHDSWGKVPAEQMPTLTRITSPIPARVGFEIHDSWETVTP